MLLLMLNRINDKLIIGLMFLITALMLFLRGVLRTIKAIFRIIFNLPYISIFNSQSKYKLGDYFFTDDGQIWTVVNKKIRYSEAYNDFVAYYQLDNFESRWYDDSDLDMGDYQYGGKL